MIHIQRTQFLEEITFIILQCLAFVDNETFPVILPQEGNRRPSGSISSDDDMRFEITRRFRTTQLVSCLC